MTPTNPTNPIHVPILDLTRQYETIKPEIDAAVANVLASGRFILGPEVKAFEEEVAAYCGVKHSIGVASGTDALLLSLRALGVGPGDKVIIPSFTFFATAGVVHNVGATPVFADIDPKTFNLDPADVRRILESSPTNPTNPTNSMNPINSSVVKAIIPVHLYGQMADMDEIMAIAKEYNIAVVEDAAQAIGAEYRSGVHSSPPHELHEPNKPYEPHEPNERVFRAGSIGDLGCFSFFPTKNLGAYGDGGMIVTNDDALAERVRILRVHGSKPKYYHRMVGVNSRLDALQAAILRVKLPHLHEWTAARQRVAARYDELFQDVQGIEIPYRAPDRSHIFHQYTIRVLDGRRDELRDFLKEQGIGTFIYYPLPLHLQECFQELGYREDDLPQSELASQEVLSLPVFPELTEAEQDYVIKQIQIATG
jgi:dTDP-4-amino-4,6-dideoxygalactose transaminase